MMLLGTADVSEGPVIKTGTTETRLRLFSFANFHAACSASVLEAGYPCQFINMKGKDSAADSCFWQFFFFSGS